MKKSYFILFVIVFYINNITAQIDKKKYDVEKINSTYSWYSKKDKAIRYKKYGILKNGEIFLQDIFEKRDSKVSNHKVLIFKGVRGLFNLKTGSWSIPLKYQDLDYIGGGVFIAKTNAKYGIIDVNNNIIADFNFRFIESFNRMENYLLVREDLSPDLYGLYNLVNRKLLIPCEYSSIQKADNLNYFKVKKDNMYNLVDIDNKVLFKTWYDEIYLPKGGRKKFIVSLKGKMGIVDINGNQIVPLEYLSIEETAYKDGSHLAQDKNGMFGFFNLDGEVTLPFKYTNIKKLGYGNSNIIANTLNKCGILRVNDGIPYEIATCNFDNIEFENKVFVVKKDGKYGLLDEFGDKITEMEYDKIECVLDKGTYRRSSSRVYIAKKDENYFLLNSFGKIVSEKGTKLLKPSYKYDSYQNLTVDNSYLIAMGANGKVGLIDAFAKEIIPMVYDEIVARKESFVVVKSNNKVGIYDFMNKKEFLQPAYDQLFGSDKGFVARIGNDFFTIYLETPLIVEKLEFEY